MVKNDKKNIYGILADKWNESFLLFKRKLGKAK
jgi:hypothetical protein